MKRLIVISFVAVLVGSTAVVASAHVGQPRLEISLERANPGGVVDLRGVEFQYEEVVALTLIGADVNVVVGEIIANVEGEFAYVVVLPTDLAEGTYFFKGTSGHHEITSSGLLVTGPALASGDGGGPRSQEDGLLAPIATVAAGVTAPLNPPQPPNPNSAWGSSLLVLGLLLAIGLGFVALVKRNDRTQTPSNVD